MYLISADASPKRTDFRIFRHRWQNGFSHPTVVAASWWPPDVDTSKSHVTLCTLGDIATQPLLLDVSQSNSTGRLALVASLSENISQRTNNSLLRCIFKVRIFTEIGSSSWGHFIITPNGTRVRTTYYAQGAYRTFWSVSLSLVGVLARVHRRCAWELSEYAIR